MGRLATNKDVLEMGILRQAYNKIAEKGNIFVLTEKGFARTLDGIKHERKIGKAVKGFEYKVPASWIEKGYVEEVRECGEIDRNK